MNVRVVLVGPQGGANVGSVCRAVKNFGAQGLFVVDGQYDRKEARRMAVHGGDIFEGRQEVATIEEAVAGAGLVVGATAKTKNYRSRTEDVRTALAAVVDEGFVGPGATSQRDVALVFGREDTGLTNDEIAHCHRLLTIPTSPEYTSLNLAQAVLVCLYELYRFVEDVAGSPISTPSIEMPADAADLETTFGDLQQILLDVGFLPAENPAHAMHSVRTLIARGGVEESELKVLRGIVAQLEWFVGGGYLVAEEKRKLGKKLK